MLQMFTAFKLIFKSLNSISKKQTKIHQLAKWNVINTTLKKSSKLHISHIH